MSRASDIQNARNRFRAARRGEECEVCHRIPERSVAEHLIPAGWLSLSDACDFRSMTYICGCVNLDDWRHVPERMAQIKLRLPLRYSDAQEFLRRAKRKQTHEALV